jgi:hypothetical protein
LSDSQMLEPDAWCRSEWRRQKPFALVQYGQFNHVPTDAEFVGEPTGPLADYAEVFVTAGGRITCCLNQDSWG